MFVGVAVAQTAQPYVTGTITTQNLTPTLVPTTGSAVCIVTAERGVVGVQVKGTYAAVGGLTAVGTVNNVDYVAVPGFTTVTSGTEGFTTINGAGFTRVCLTAQGVVTPTANVTLRSTDLSAGGSSSGGTSDATAAKQDIGNASLASIDGKTPALVSGRQPVDGSGVTQPISASTLPLPTGASTAAKQDTVIASLASLDTKTPASPATTGNQTTQITAEQAIQVTIGATGDAKATVDATGTVNAKLRLFSEQFGSITETAPASDTASSGLNGRLQRIAQNISTFLAKFTTTANADASRLPVSVDIASPVTGSSVAAGNLSGYPFAVGKSAQSVIVNVTANTATSVVFEYSTDGTAAYLPVLCYQSTATGAGSRASSTATTGSWECPIWGTHFNARQTGSGGATAISTPTARTVASVTTVYVANTPNVIGQTAQGSAVGNTPFLMGLEARTTTGTAVASGQAVRETGTTDGKAVVLIGGVPELSWRYAAATNGISNTTTAVTIKAACTDRCYVSYIDLMCESLGAATEIAIRDGAGGTVLWKTKVGTAGQALISLPQNPPIKGTSATLLEAVTLTASVTGACYINAGGYDAK